MIWKIPKYLKTKESYIFGVHSSTIGAIRKKENWNFPEALSP
jgi:hypothetical protein